jgi:hypothetical protein
VTLTTHLYLVPSSRMSRSYTSSPPCRLHGEQRASFSLFLILLYNYTFFLNYVLPLSVVVLHFDTVWTLRMPYTNVLDKHTASTTILEDDDSMFLRNVRFTCSEMAREASFTEYHTNKSGPKRQYVFEISRYITAKTFNSHLDKQLLVLKIK